ncbi:cell division protein FtsZ [Myxococcota bacterium]|nr:cell division protein FtsZ [Myxococcota bacterium]MBU1537451.1 cell division protein FtsZ [Myxococcota bacterium]
MPYTIEDVITGEARIKIIGVGGAGGNAVKSMIDKNLQGVSFIVANTDVQALEDNPATVKMQLGSKLTNGLGAGADPEKGRMAAEENAQEIMSKLEGADMIFIATGMGGGTGTGASPVIAAMAKKTGALTVGVVTKPFKFEGRRRMRMAMEGIRRLQEEVDALIVIPNDRLLSNLANVSVKAAFERADQVLLNAAKGITDLINHHGYINVDFMDVRSVMMDKGRALMGTGSFKGDNAAVEAVRNAISSPLLEDVSIEGATGVLINITCPPNIPLQAISEAAMLVEDAANEDANVIWGTVFDPTLEDEVQVTIIATGFESLDQAEDSPTPPAPQKAQANFTSNMQGISKRPSQLTMNYQIQNRETGEQRRVSSREIPALRPDTCEIAPMNETRPATPVGQSDLSQPAYLRRLNTQVNQPPVS